MTRNYYGVSNAAKLHKSQNWRYSQAILGGKIFALAALIWFYFKLVEVLLWLF